MATSWSTLHTSRVVQPPPPSASSSKSSRLAGSSGSNKQRAKLPSHLSSTEMPAPGTALPLDTPMLELSQDSMLSPSALASGSRSSSLAGRKRPRDSDGATSNAAALARANRRTKSVGDTRRSQVQGQVRDSSTSSKDREAFQRGLIAVFVPKALRDSTRGEMGNYNDLLAHFLPTASAPVPALPPLLPLLRAISAQVSLLQPGVHSALVSAIIDLPWAHGDERFVKTFVGWAGVLVSAHPDWTKEVVQMAAKGLAWQNPTKLRADSPISRRTYHARYHLLLSHLLSLVPTLPNLLGPILIRKFPNKRENEVVQTTWVRNMCELISYCPELGARIWSEIVDRMLRIDVEINNSLEEEDDDDEDDEDDDDAEIDAPMLSASGMLDPFDLATTQDIPKALADNDDSDDESDGEVDPGDVSSVDGDRSDDDKDEQDEIKLLNQAEKKRQAVKVMRGKLDGMLFHFFRHLEEYMGDGERRQSAAEMAAERMGNVPTGASSGQSTPTSEAPSVSWGGPTTPGIATSRPAPTPAQSLAHFQTLLNLFTRQILPTSSTQHIPFLLFLCSSFSHAHTDLFLGLLVSQALYASTTASPAASAQPVSISQRIAATVYIGSVVCRARFVTDESARQVMAYLLAYIDGKMAQSHQTKQLDELPLFYAVCQAVMLIFCFRWRAFTTQPKEGDGDEGVVGEMEIEMDSEVESGSDGKWIKDLEVLQRAITSELNPLLGCNSTVVNTFAKVAHHTNFAYCFSIIEANQQSTARSGTGSSHSLSTLAQTPLQGQSVTQANVSGNGLKRLPSMVASRQNSTSSSSTYAIPRKARQSNIDAGLDSYYPFDPFTLPRSKRYIEGIYRTWGEVSIPLDDDDDDSEDESEDEEEEDESDVDSVLDHPTGRPVALPKNKTGSSSWYEARRRLMVGSKDDGLSSSLEGMSISPGIAGYMRRR